jgi:Fe2+ or Zn2+ uptake regulation protein
MQLNCINLYYCYSQTMQQTRKTQVKEKVAHILQAYATPLSLGEIYEYTLVSLPKTAYSTIFRVVSAMEREGTVRRIDWRERGSRYEWSDLPHHHHIVCQVCGLLQDIDDATLNFNEEKITEITGYLVKHHSIELEGICADCLIKHI